MTDILTITFFIATLTCFAGMVGLVSSKDGDPPQFHMILIFAMFFLLVLMFVQAVEA